MDIRKTLQKYAISMALAYPVNSYGQTPVPDGLDNKLQQQQSPDALIDQINELEKDTNPEKSEEDVTDTVIYDEVTDEVSSTFSKQEFMVNRIEVSESHFLSQKDLSAITSEHEGKFQTLYELFEMAKKINALYKEKGLITSKAIIPPQKIQHGTVKVELIEGKIGKILFEGNKRAREQYLRWIVGVKEGQYLNLKKLEKKLIHLNKSSSNILVSTRLKPGDDHATSDILIRTKESPPYSLSYYSDNKGIRSTGYLRNSVLLQSNMPIGIDDRFLAGFTDTRGGTSYFASSELPVTPYNTKFRLLYSEGDQNIDGGQNLNIEGNTRLFSTRILQPFIIDSLTKASLSYEFVSSNSENDFRNKDSSNSVIIQKHSISKHIISMNLQKSSRSTIWDIKLSAHRVESDSTTNSIKTLPQINSKYVFQIARVQNLSKRLSIHAKLDLQHTDSNDLPPAEQFQLGGANNLAYDTSEWSGPDGYSASIESSYRLNLNEKWSIPFISNTKAFVFFQHGGINPFTPADVDEIKRESFANSMAMGIKGTILARGQYSLMLTKQLDQIHKDRTRDQLVIFSARLTF